MRLAVATIDGCDAAAVSLIQKRSIGTQSSTSDVPRAVDAIQYETGEGPCLDAIRDDGVFRTGNLEVESRWPAFSSRGIVRPA